MRQIDSMFGDLEDELAIAPAKNAKKAGNTNARQLAASAFKKKEVTKRIFHM